MLDSVILITLFIISLPLLYQSVSTAALTVLMETTSPATRATDMFHASGVIYSIGLVQNLVRTKLSYGTTFSKDAIYVPLPVTRTIYRNLTENLEQIFFVKNCICSL